MKAQGPGQSQTRWHILFSAVSFLTCVVGIIALFSPQAVKFFYITLVISILIAVTAVLDMLRLLIEQNGRNEKDLSDILAATKSNRSILAQIAEDVRMTEAAKTIAFRDAELDRLRQSVYSKLHQRDFETVEFMIANISRNGEYKEISDELRLACDKFRNSDDVQRGQQIAEYIERLIEQRQWAEAGRQIEQFSTAFAYGDKANLLRRKLNESKESRKKILLSQWDEAINRKETDRSLEILKELDVYLTPAEGLALQEAASEVFKNKLHNMGVKFSLAVSDKNWDDALSTGRQIIREFPNSKMADEIRGKMSILTQLAGK